MSDWSRVTVQIDEDGGVVGVDIGSEVDRDNLTEERPETPPLPDDPNVGRTLWPLG
ncbi:MAG: hypothetical protein M3144_10965 [Actinomycetota bacterium]|nr:hypothetical protein [Actinomycetota bacterium]